MLRRHFCCLLILIVPVVLVAQKKKSIPGGFSWVENRSLLIGIREVSCAEWREYMDASGLDPALLPVANDITSRCLFEVKGEEITLREARAVYRDTSFVDSSNGKKIHAVEKCENMPVTGITYEQALAYCEWLSERYVDIPKYSGHKLNFRLATPAEMDSLLMDNFSFWKEGDENYVAFQKGINKHGCAIYNHRHDSWCATNILMKKEFGYGVPMQEGVFFPDMNGLLDLMGNVAEMTSVKGVAKGGSCVHIAAECQPGVENKYEGPQSWLGFRVVADFRR